MHEHPGGTKVLCNDLTKDGRTIHAAIDGSLKQTKGTFGWKLLDHHLQEIYEGAGPVDAMPSLTSCTRSEIYGIAAILEFLYQFASFHRLQINSTITIRVICDSETAISSAEARVSAQWERHRIMQNYDILAHVESLLKQIPMDQIPPGQQNRLF